MGDADGNQGDETEQALDADEPARAVWFAIPLRRLFLFTLLGGWFYAVYWMYRSWLAYRASWGYSRQREWREIYERTGFRVSPFCRAALGAYCYGLLVALRREARAAGIKVWIWPWPTFALGALASSLTDPWLQRGLMAVLFLPAQAAANRLQERTSASQTTEPVAGGDILWILIGLCSAWLVLAGGGR